MEANQQKQEEVESDEEFASRHGLKITYLDRHTYSILIVLGPCGVVHIPLDKFTDPKSIVEFQLTSFRDSHAMKFIYRSKDTWDKVDLEIWGLDLPSFRRISAYANARVAECFTRYVTSGVKSE